MAVFDEILKLMSVFFSMETGSPFMTLVGLVGEIWDEKANQKIVL